MARHEQQREDLLREATALVRRVELSLPWHKENVVVGYRRNEAPSFFFGEDPVYQFNANGELRRAYRDRRLIKAEAGKLASLQRVRNGREVSLVRHDLTSDETDRFIGEMTATLKQFVETLQENDYEIVGQIPSDENVVASIIETTQSILGEIRIADQPNV